MVRPLTEEEKLQELESFEPENLRPEFVNQMLELRNKVLHRVKPKIINGKRLTGPMLANLANVYVQSINEGAIPNIENAWTYICQTECQKSLENSIEVFEEKLGQVEIPAEEDELEEDFKHAKKAALSYFDDQAVGAVAEDFLKELHEKMDIRFINL